MNKRELEAYQRGNNIGKIDGQSEYTIVKQMWDTTTDTLQYWWLSPKYILAQTRHEFIIYEKTKEVDPWNGDKWKVYARVDCRYILHSASASLYVSSAYKAKPFLFLLEEVDADTIRMTKWDILPEEGATELEEVFRKTEEIEIDIVRRELGEKLAGPMEGGLPFKFYTYSKFSADTLLGVAQVSSTRVKTGKGIVEMVGIALNKNLDQWTLIIDKRGSGANITTTYRVIHGYGRVGLKGEITGGQFPTVYMNVEYGFSGTVQPVSNLKGNTNYADPDSFNVVDVAELFVFNGGIYGTATKQYYVMPSCNSLVSHITLDIGTGRFVMQLIDMMNNYEVVYKSPSRVMCRLDGLNGREVNLFDLWPSSGFISSAIRTIVKIASFGYMRVIYQNILFTNLLYMQQTLGQYAYVWRNSNYIPDKGEGDLLENNKETGMDSVDKVNGSSDPKSDVTLMMRDDFLFDVQRVKQKYTQSESDFDSLWLRTFFVVANSLLAATGISAPNLTKAIMNTGTVASSFAAGFLSSLAGQVPDSISNNASTLWLSGTSYVTATKRLDMFYSTSDDAKFWCGRGFVNHNFVSQCLAQSSTSVHVQGYVLSNAVINAEILKLTINIQIMIQTALMEFLEKEADAMGGSGLLTIVGLASGTNIAGGIASIAFALAAKVIKGFIYVAKLGIEAIDTMLATTGIYPNNKTSVIKQVSKHNYDIEGTHKYGNKSISFMWPAYGVYHRVKYTDEYVEARCENIPFSLDFTNEGNGSEVYTDKTLDLTTQEAGAYSFLADQDNIPYYQAMMRGAKVERTAPANTAVIEGSTGFMPKDDYKNENISVSPPVFPAVITHDYEIDREWNVGVCASNGAVVWVFCKDTKLIDGDYTNIVDTGAFCGVACSYTAIELKPRIIRKYVRPWAVTPQALAFNITGLNVVYDKKFYHAFDGMSYRYVEWHGDSGINKEFLWRHYMFQKNDRFKRSNILPPNQFIGNFNSRPVISYSAFDEMENVVTSFSQNQGLANEIPGENKDLQRYSIPVFTEPVSTLPAVVKTLSSYQLAVVDGNTSLTTDLRNTQGEYKAPKSTDFAIGDQMFRVTDEYICLLQNESGVVVVHKLVPILGLTYLGSTLQQAFFYSQATRSYYVYTGGTSLNKIAMIERFRNLLSGHWDFVNQQVVLDALVTMDRIDRNVHDDEDEVDNLMVPILDNGGFAGELTPPNYNIMNSESWFKILSMPTGLVYQGPNRVQINRFIFNAYMLEDVLRNKGKWLKPSREIYHPFREYSFRYEGIDHYPDYRVPKNQRLIGWTHNMFLLVTSPLGLDKGVDCLFEWELVFAWTVEMDKIFGDSEYVCVNVMAETFCPGGKVFSRPSHVFLYKKLFEFSENVGYYTYRYTGNNGAGNRERLHIWCDGVIAMSQLKVYCTPMTERRQAPLVIQEDIARYKEM